MNNKTIKKREKKKKEDTRHTRLHIGKVAGRDLSRM
jgi:hypothetical protein